MFKTQGNIVEFHKFPDGTYNLIKCFESIELSDSMCIDWFYERPEEESQLWYLIKYLKSRNVVKIFLFLPYVPNGRMDRVHKETEGFTLKYFAEYINSLNFAGVYVTDPHSQATIDLIKNSINLSPMKYIRKAFEQSRSDILFFPDEGACRRYKSVFKEVGIECYYGIKTRDWETGKITDYKMDVLKEFNPEDRILIVDDICSYGGTFYHAAKLLKEHDAKHISLYATHCESSIYLGKLFEDPDFIERVYTTNSLHCGEHKKINCSKVTIFEM